jgi:predicted ATPase
MKLLSLKASRYRSLRDETIAFTDLNLFIGVNASGKSTILDALRFLHEGVS